MQNYLMIIRICCDKIRHNNFFYVPQNNQYILIEIKSENIDCQNKIRIVFAIIIFERILVFFTAIKEGIYL